MPTAIITSAAYITVASAGAPTVVFGQSDFTQLEVAPISISSPELSIYNVRNASSTIDQIVGIDVSAGELSTRSTVRVITGTTTPVRRAWQARLGAKMDDVLRKTMDNKISLSSYPVDMVRVAVKRDPRTQDLISRTIVANDVMPLYFEKALNELPLRRMEYADTEQVILTIDATKLTEIKVKCPISETLDRGDLLFRVLRDDYSERPIVLILQVKEELGTIGYSKLIQIDYVLSYYDEKLPDSVIASVIDSTSKREVIEW